MRRQSDKPLFGVLLPTRETVLSGQHDVSPLIDLACEAERVGFASVWAGESIVARPRFEPLTLLAAVAARTGRIRVGTAVLLPAQHQLIRLAQSLATLDQISQGRLIVGSGIGIDNPETRAEFMALGVPFGERVGRTVDAVRFCKEVWEGSAARSRYWTIETREVLPAPHQKGGPPFWTGSTVNREQSLQRAGRLFDGWMPTAATPEAYSQGWERVREVAVAAGREDRITAAAYLTVNVARDVAAAERELGEYMEGYYGLPFAVMRKVQGCFAGQPDACAKWLGEFVEAGARHIVLRFGSRDLARQLETAGAELIPRFA
jgi:alkanesulfonate monooxygenase SsuD/methylene tetrahydromethanopterin reductase-like flavin-dependent oxidoreductase (luciferase family)